MLSWGSTHSVWPVDFGKPLCQGLHAGCWSGRHQLGVEGGGTAGCLAWLRDTVRLGSWLGSAQVAHTQIRIPAAQDGERVAEEAQALPG